MPITMMFAARQIGMRYRCYVTDHRVMVEGQLRTDERFEFDHVSGISDPAREVFDLGGAVKFFDNQPPALVESGALPAGKKRLVGFKPPDPPGGGRMTDRVEAMRLFKERAGAEKIVEGRIEGPCSHG